jgi:hypothetical protein
MQRDSKTPRRVRVERGIYRSPATGGYEIQYTDSSGSVRWRRVQGGLREARHAGQRCRRGSVAASSSSARADARGGGRRVVRSAASPAVA